MTFAMMGDIEEGFCCPCIYDGVIGCQIWQLDGRCCVVL